MPFHQVLLEVAEPIWRAMLDHRFLRETAENTISRERFANWLQQDYLFVREAVPFIAALSAKAAVPMRRPFAETLVGLHQELDLFEQMATEHEVSLTDIEISPTCHAYVQFLLATAYHESFAVGFTVLYGAEKAYLDSWSWVKEHQREASPWQRFIDHWSSEAFRGWVGWLETELDWLSERLSAEERARMQEAFLTTARYEYRFWEMAASGESW